MTLCTWCGQETQSEVICDWCKRPLPTGAPVSGRAELDFLREETDDRPAYVTMGLVGVGIAACATLLYFLLQGPGDSGVPGGPRDTLTASARTPSPRFDPPPTAPNDQWRNINLEGLPGRVRVLPPVYRPRGPEAVSNSTVPVTPDFPSVVKISRAQLTMVSLPGGKKQVLGKVDIENLSDRNVVDFRVELVWGAQTYLMTPMAGNTRNLKPLEQRALRIGKRLGFQVASPAIPPPADGPPHSVRLLAWLDGKPNNSLDEYSVR